MRAIPTPAQLAQYNANGIPSHRSLEHQNVCPAAQIIQSSSKRYAPENSKSSSHRIASIDLGLGRRAHSRLCCISCLLLSICLLRCKLCLLCCQLCALTPHHALLLLGSHECAVICEPARLMRKWLRGLRRGAIHHRGLDHGILNVWSTVLRVGWCRCRVRGAWLCR